MPRNVLFICSQNRLRSPTAEQIFADWPGIETSSAGLNYGADNPVTPELLEWADLGEESLFTRSRRTASPPLNSGVRTHMSLPTIDELVALYSQTKGSDVGQAEHRLFQRYGLEPLVPLLANAYPLIRRGSGRASILFWLPRYARVRQDVVSLALSALADHSYIVREYACSILAYSLRSGVIPQLTSLQAHPDLKTRAAATAGIDAISSKNHHYFVDRKHSGSTFWGVNPGDVPGQPF